MLAENSLLERECSAGIVIVEVPWVLRNATAREKKEVRHTQMQRISFRHAYILELVIKCHIQFTGSNYQQWRRQAPIKGRRYHQRRRDGKSIAR